MILGTLTTLAMLACTGSGDVSDARQSDSSYASAIGNREACCGSYVLITVVNGATGHRRAACTLNGYLISSLWMESGLPDTGETSDTLRRMALQNRRHVFTFYKPQALRNMPITFTEADLGRVREATRSMSPSQALEAMKPGGALSDLKLQGTDWGEPLRDAVACAFVERGASAGVPDFGDIWITLPSAPAPASGTASS